MFKFVADFGNASIDFYMPSVVVIKILYLKPRSKHMQPSLFNLTNFRHFRNDWIHTHVCINSFHIYLWCFYFHCLLSYFINIHSHLFAYALSKLWKTQTQPSWKTNKHTNQYKPIKLFNEYSITPKLMRWRHCFDCA